MYSQTPSVQQIPTSSRSTGRKTLRIYWQEPPRIGVVHGCDVTGIEEFKVSLVKAVMKLVVLRSRQIDMFNGMKGGYKSPERELMELARPGSERKLLNASDTAGNHLDEFYW